MDAFDFVCMYALCYIFTNFNYVHIEFLTMLKFNDDSSHSLSSTQTQPQSAVHNHENVVAVGSVINTTQLSCGMDIVYSLYIMQCTCIVTV